MTSHPLLHTIAILGALAAIASLSSARAATYIEARVTSAGPASESALYRLYLQDGTLRAEDADGYHVTLLVNDQLEVLDTTHKTVATLDHTALAFLSPNTLRLRQAIEARTAGLPPAQQALAAKYLNRLAPAPQSTSADEPHATPLSERLEFRSYPVWQHDGADHPESQYLLWQSPTPSALEDWTRSLQSLDRLTAGVSFPVATNALLRLFAHERDFARLPGLPMLIRDFGADGKLRTTMRLRFSTIKPVPTDRFAVPAGYRAEISTESLVPSSP